MTPSDYQALAQRTECDQTRAVGRIANLSFNKTKDYNPEQLQAIRVNHACLGIATEAGELLSLVEKWIYYGQELDQTGLKEEAGDVLWYLAQLCNACGWSLESVMEANVAKLCTRYPEKYSDERAIEKNRNKREEVAAIKMYDGTRPGKIVESQGAHPTPNQPHLQAGTSGGTLSTIAEASLNSWQGWPPCERCGQPAVNAAHDATKDGSREESHYYCREHGRPARIIGDNSGMRGE